METPENKTKHKGFAIPGIAVVGCLASGVLACIGGILGLVQFHIGGAGICFVAAALAFGVIVYASFSN